jgi:protein FRA10AC1
MHSLTLGRFLREETEESPSYGERLAIKYYQKLFKEYALCDLSRFKSGAVALRWRVEAEVVKGKGQFVCGDVSCSNSDGLVSYEVPFAYREDEEEKLALVKVRLCPTCGPKLSFKRERDLKRSEAKLKSKEAKRRRLSTDLTREDGASPDDAPIDVDVIEGPAQPQEEGPPRPARGVDPERAFWGGRAEVEKTADDEFDEYFAEMFP